MFKNSYRVKFIIGLITIILIVMMFPRGESLESEVEVGDIWIEEDLIASTTFEVLKDPQLYNEEAAQARASVKPVFVYKENTIQEQRDSLRNYNQYLQEVLSNDIFSDIPTGLSKTFLTRNSYQTLLNLKKLENSLTIGAAYNLNDIFSQSLNVLSEVYDRGILDNEYDEISRDTISVREGKFQRYFQKTYFHTPGSAVNFVREYLSGNSKFNPSVVETMTEYISYFIKPDVVYNAELTREAKSLAENKVSRNIGIVNENERIVAKHNRITPEIKLKIDSYKIAKGEESGLVDIIIQFVGKSIHVVLILLLFYAYLFLFRREIFNDNTKILLIAVIIVLVAFNSYLISHFNVQEPVEYLILVPVAAMLFTIFFDSRIGFYGTVVVALIAGGLRGNDYVFAVTNIIAGGFASYTVRDIKNRTQIFTSILSVLAGYILAILAFGLERFAPFTEIGMKSVFAAGNALVSPVLTYGLIIFIERSFKITTDLTLLELTDFNSPLLKELQRTAPGTFTHSMVIGTMVENAAEEIDANPILARVGAYYHDIGKTISPQSFVENQLRDNNIHEKLPPEKSAQVIINHVIKGIELGRKHNLPKEIIEFIPAHHGTLFASFFYEKAKKEYGEENVNKEQFRYPGPKPQTKETALVMLADACESAVRSMVDADVKQVENLISNLFNSRIQDGQLDESPLTIRDIAVTKEIYLNILVGQHHKRIRYPKQEELENDKKEENGE